MSGTRAGLEHPDCYARELACCSTEMSREHYLTEAVQKAIARGKSIEVRGLAWQPEGASQVISTKKLTGWILCKAHNGALSDLDGEALKWVQSADRIHEGFNDGKDEEFLIAGDKLERWMLKTLCGPVASGSLRNLVGQRIEDWQSPRLWLEIIFQGRPFPDGCGAFVSYKDAGTVEAISPELLRMTPICDHGNGIWGMRLWLFNVEYVLSMHPVVRDAPQRLLDDSVYRPAGLYYDDPLCRKRLNLRWASPTTPAVIPIRRVLL